MSSVIVITNTDATETKAFRQKLTNPERKILFVATHIVIEMYIYYKTYRPSLSSRTM